MTMNALPATISASATTPSHVSRSARVIVRARALSTPPRPTRPRTAGASRRGSVLASPDMLRARRSEPPKVRDMWWRSDGCDVDGLRPLIALLGVVGDLRALLQRAVTLAVDAGVMYEQVLVAVVGGDEA